MDLSQAHKRLLADASLQFRFEPAPTPKPPDWLKPLLDFLKAAAPALQWAFWIGLVAGVALILFFIGRELLRLRWPERFGRRRPVLLGDPSWRPTEAQARALLEDVDRLAAQGRFAEAVHLLLHRSIQDIQDHRPRLVRPALTSRDISALPTLPDAARAAFAGIARVVERSRFGGDPVDADAFAACRRAYEAFAFPEVWA
jgi:hypothetical protein